MPPRGVDVLVAGGGPAGAMAAALLAGAGRRVVLYERTTGPHPKVCGEFLSGEAAGPLARLGLDPVRLGAVPVERLRLAGAGGEVSCRLPFPAWGLSRDVLDEALLAAAAAHGVELRRGATVRTVAAVADGLRVEAAGASLTAARVLLATGKHDLRAHRRPPGRVNDLIGFKQHWRLAARARAGLDGHVEMHLFAGGYAGFQPVEDGRVNLCLVVGRGPFERLGHSWPAVLAHVGAASPGFAARLDGGTPCRPRPLAVAGIPYGFVHRADRHAGPHPGPHPGLHRVGDQLVVIPSLTGDGMAIALDSAVRAAGRVLQGGPPADGAPYARQVSLAHAAARVATSGVGGTLATALARMAPGLAEGMVGALASGTRSPAAAAQVQPE